MKNKSKFVSFFQLEDDAEEKEESQIKSISQPSEPQHIGFFRFVQVFAVLCMLAGIVAAFALFISEEFVSGFCALLSGVFLFCVLYFIGIVGERFMWLEFNISGKVSNSEYKDELQNK